jgi:PPK2 family polyphosphate:nucleotide phosphotransferase
VDSLRVPPEGVDLSAIDTRATPGIRRGKREALEQQPKLAARLAELQEKLYAEGRTGGSRSVLLIIQGLDTSGKSGTVKHVIGQVDPQGAQITAFKEPTPEERRHPFLWRVKRRLPRPGLIGVFDRSHYEDIVAVRVRKLAPPKTWSRRYGTVNRFEQELAAAGTTVVKFFLHISFDEWRERQLARLDDPAKHWKFDPGDIDDALLWDDYQLAYSDVLRRCNSDDAPWYVIPADRKWYRNHAITRVLIEHLDAMDLRWPEARFDVEEQRARLLAIDKPSR